MSTKQYWYLKTGNSLELEVDRTEKSIFLTNCSQYAAFIERQRKENDVGKISADWTKANTLLYCKASQWELYKVRRAWDYKLKLWVS